MLISEIQTKEGIYFLYYDIDSRLYGISRKKYPYIHCAYATLEALFKTKGL